MVAYYGKNVFGFIQTGLTSSTEVKYLAVLDTSSDLIRNNRTTHMLHKTTGMFVLVIIITRMIVTTPMSRAKGLRTFAGNT
jgi:hypothetical protein